MPIRTGEKKGSNVLDRTFTLEGQDGGSKPGFAYFFICRKAAWVWRCGDRGNGKVCGSGRLGLCVFQLFLGPMVLPLKEKRGSGLFLVIEYSFA